MVMAVVVLVPLMYGSELYGTTEVPNSETHICKTKVSTSKCHKLNWVVPKLKLVWVT